MRVQPRHTRGIDGLTPAGMRVDGHAPTGASTGEKPLRIRYNTALLRFPACAPRTIRLPAG
jgi:hypothetical protein